MRHLDALIVTCALVLFGLPMAAHSQTPSPIIRISVADEMYKRMGISKEAAVGGCPSHCSGRGFCARQPDRCSIKTEFSNLTVDSIESVVFREPDPRELPAFRDEQFKDWINCRSSEYTWNEKFTYTSRASISVTNTTVLSDVTDHSHKLDLTPTFLAKMGATVGSADSRSITLTITNDVSTTRSEDITLDRQDETKVPPWTRYTEFFSDEKRKARIPVRMIALVDGEIRRNYYLYPQGQLWQSDRLASIKGKLLNDELRKFSVYAVIEVLGSDRQLHVRLTEERVPKDSPLCIGPPRNAK